MVYERIGIDWCEKKTCALATSHVCAVIPTEVFVTYEMGREEQ